MRLEINGRRKDDQKRVRHVLYLTGADQRWLGGGAEGDMPDLGRRLPIAQEHDMVVVGRNELHALRQHLEQEEALLPDGLRPFWLSVIDADDAATDD